MDLKSIIRPQLWNEISKSYIAENYKTAILDSMRYLTQIIREKSGLDIDGVPLVNQAFGGEEPKLRLNKLQTRSEKDEQSGFQFIVSGLYSAIRNPRTHEGIQDSKIVADPIIYFINYILSVIDVAKPPFTIENFISRVVDEDFVQSKEYTIELLKEIPKNRYLETLIEIYRHKANCNDRTLELIFKELIPRIKKNEIREFIAVVSEELDTVSEVDLIVTILRIFPSEAWQELKLTARMRIENKLIKSIRSGKIGTSHGSLLAGGLGTWATRIINYFTLKEELRSAVFYNLLEDDIRGKSYIVTYFISHFPVIFTQDYHYYYAAKAMRDLITAGDLDARNKIRYFAENCPDGYLQTIKDVFKDWTDESNPEFALKDGSPFLGNIPKEIEKKFEEAYEDDIPF